VPSDRSEAISRQEELQFRNFIIPEVAKPRLRISLLRTSRYQELLLAEFPMFLDMPITPFKIQIGLTRGSFNSNLQQER